MNDASDLFDEDDRGATREGPSRGRETIPEAPAPVVGGGSETSPFSAALSA